MKALKYTLLATSFALLSACGGGWGGGGGEQATNYTAQYRDAPVAGLRYAASPSGLSGLTDSNGYFKYQRGDKVYFSIVTPGGDIGAGTVSPQAPNSASVVVPVSVLSMSNGVQIAQVLQSLGGTGQVIDVTSANPKVAAIDTTEKVSIVNSFVGTSGGASVSSVIPNLISSSTAVTNAMNSLSGVSAPLSSSLSSLISDGNYYYFQQTNPGSTSGGGFVAFGASIISIGGGSGSWSVTGEKTFTFNFGGVSYSIGVGYLDGNAGIYSNAYSSRGTDYSGTGIYRKIRKASESGLAADGRLNGQSVYVGGLNLLCGGSQATAAFKLSFLAGNRFEAYCDASLYASGTVSNDSNISGVVHLTSNTFGEIAVGLTSDSVVNGNTILSGSLAAVNIGGGCSVQSPCVNLSMLFPSGPQLFPLNLFSTQEALISVYSQGLQATFDLIGTATRSGQSSPVTAILTYVSAPATPATFEGSSGYKVARTLNGSFLSNSVSSPVSSTSYSYLNSRLQTVGEVYSDKYCISLTPTSFPAFLSPGDSGELDSSQCYTTSTKSISVGKIRRSYLAAMGAGGKLSFEISSSIYDSNNLRIGSGKTVYGASLSGKPSIDGINILSTENGTTLSLTSR